MSTITHSKQRGTIPAKNQYVSILCGVSCSCHNSQYSSLLALSFFLLQATHAQSKPTRFETEREISRLVGELDQWDSLGAQGTPHHTALLEQIVKLVDQLEQRRDDGVDPAMQRYLNLLGRL